MKEHAEGQHSTYRVEDKRCTGQLSETLVKPRKTLPLLVTITGLSLQDFPAGTTQYHGPAGPDQVADYDGAALYCHAEGDTAAGITLTINERAPSSLVQAIADVRHVKLEWTRDGKTSHMNWDIPVGATYDPGLPLDHHLEFTNPELTEATLVVRRPVAAESVANSLGLIVLGKPLTGGAARGYFVNVPMGPSALDFTSISISWSPDHSAAGPIGGGNVP
jgi:hypothetical protein